MQTNGNLIRRKRVESGRSLRAFAKAVSLGYDTISRIETGKSAPHPSTLKKIADGLGLRVADLLLDAAE
ncbi:helix-turn-helix domain-containing protein [Streptomyces coelicoflavus]|uniref:helix-turn-helix domain-containing protein n=1 Tax=Streptomyces coelicoflavus TaxID=285562 RepID=UPI003691D0BC